MTCDCRHPGCPSRINASRAALLAELREVLPDAEPHGMMTGDLLLFTSPSTGIRANYWTGTNPSWTFSVDSGRQPSPAGALDGLFAAVQGVKP